MESNGRGTELKPKDDNDEAKVKEVSSWADISLVFFFQNVKDIMKSIANVRNDRAKKQQAAKWTKMPSETKTKVIKNWEQKALT